jgi:hypothetical protein
MRLTNFRYSIPQLIGRGTENRTLIYWLKASYFPIKLYPHCKEPLAKSMTYPKAILAHPTGIEPVFAD